MRVPRLLAVLAVALGLGVLVAGPAAADGPDIPWPDERNLVGSGDLSGWSHSPRGTAAQGEALFSYWFSEPIWVAHADYPYFSQLVSYNYMGKGPAQLRVGASLICENQSTFRLTEQQAFTVDVVSLGTSFNQSTWQASNQSTYLGALSYAFNYLRCGAGSVPVGVVSFVWTRSDNTYSWYMARRMVWFADQEHETPTGQGPQWCRSVFGQNYTKTSTAVIDGVTYAAHEFGCFGDYLTDGDEYDWSTDFDVVCAGAPQMDIMHLGNLPDWISHYATCLFNPQGGWDQEGKIGTTVEAGWYGEIRGIGEDVQTTADGIGGGGGGGCGDLVTDLPGILGSISTCGLAGMWPENMSNLAGIALVGMSSFACLFLVLRVMGISGGKD